jgi:hypothetical protein
LKDDEVGLWKGGRFDEAELNAEMENLITLADMNFTTINFALRGVKKIVFYHGFTRLL